MPKAKTKIAKHKSKAAKRKLNTAVTISHFKAKTYLVRNADDAAASQGTSLNLEKVNIAVNQALSAWGSVSPINFIPVASGVTPDIDIHFVNTGHDPQLGNALIEIHIGNSLFVDVYNETKFYPSYDGPYDLVAEIAHEVGHKLGINHPPLIPGTDIETSPDALMSEGFSPGLVERFLKPYDITEVQRLYGTISLGTAILCNLQTDVTTGTLEGDVHFIKGRNFIQLDGPVGKSVTMTASVQGTKNKTINAVNFKFTTYSPNVIVNTVELYDGSVLLQKYYTCCRNAENANNQVWPWNIKLGFLKRRKMLTGLVIKVNIQFKRFPSDNRWDYGVVQFTSISAEPLPQLPDIPPIDTV
jgi:hypothetical protein